MRNEERRFGGKIALITGASTGIGRATALAFAREGATVAIDDMNEAGSTSFRTSGLTFAASKTRSCAKKASITSRTAGARLMCNEATRSTIRSNSRAIATVFEELSQATVPALSRSTSRASNASSSITRLAACPSGPMTARSRRGQWSRHCHSRPKLCCARSSIACMSSN